MTAAAQKDGGRGLERDKVVTAALELLDEAGFGGLSLRRVAARLDVKAAALYWHFENKQDLIDALAERIMLTEFRQASRPAADSDWRTLLTLVGETHRSALQRYRDGAELMAHANLRNDAMLDGMEQLLLSLQRQGFTLQQAMEGFYTVVRFTIGCVFEEQADPRSAHAADHSKRVERIRQLTTSHPTIAQAFGEAFFGEERGPDYLFHQGLSLILDGLAARNGNTLDVHRKRG